MRPRQLVVITGTGTEVGKTWVAVRVVGGLIERGQKVAARKPAQSYSPDHMLTDADVLAAASGESPLDVCPKPRWYPLAMAPPMAAAALGRPVPKLAELAQEVTVSWPIRRVDVGIVETAGGVASPQATDGDTVDLCRALDADLAVLVADPGLGTINSVRLAARALSPLAVVVYLNRFDTDYKLHEANRDWLTRRDGLRVTTDLTELLECIAGDRD